ncbi:MAG: MiaB/RimO family radical SAM methylthiotransferase [Endomicrobium sp.]|jgi:threonylcarbamoyladenosine tRNA methylthiotransferase MtaB|nr:MiaB/RimO family radical SAM methylthiotransferase [Endomicrobium sp.]
MKKYHIHTFGCKVNQYESQLISEKFKNDNFEYTKNLEEANIIVLNSCTVTSKTDKKCEHFLNKITKLPKKPKIILTGCIAKNKNDRIRKILHNSNHNIELITDKTKLFIDSQVQTVRHFDKHSRAFLKIQDGCNSFCSYCIIPYVRNVLWNKPEEKIISEIKNFVKCGYYEIVITGINVGKYNDKLSTCFSDLIKKIIKIPLNFRIRISSIELNDIDNKLIELIMENPEKICNHLHIPMQSGSDEILKKMNRMYLSKKFEKKIIKIEKTLPDIALTTDIITGFPGETLKHHKETCNIIKRNMFAKLHIFKYSDRNGTLASKFTNKVHINEINDRFNELSEVNTCKKNEFLKKNIGKKKRSVKIGKFHALTDNYIKVKLQKNDNKFCQDISKQQHTNDKYSQLLRNGIFEIKITEKTAKI